ncbi:MAG TPA: hypothetical protein ENN64_00075 [bacterium]|nr:hypothetical protein [bacterium]
MKNMSKKYMDKVEAEKPHFIQSAVNKGYDQKNVEKVWDKLLKFANYGFNKAHSTSYAYVSYWTAYLKTYYPLEFMSALLESDIDNFDRLVVDLEECKRLGIEILSPSINSSNPRFKVENEHQIRFGLAGIKNVGEEIATKIVGEREKNGKYLNVDDFIYRTIPIKINKRVLEYLVKAGTLDEFGDRHGILEMVEPLFEKYKKQRESEKLGQFGLFQSDKKDRTHIEIKSPIPVIKENKKFEKLQWEKELLGFYMTNHPLDEFEEFLAEKNVLPINTLQNRVENEIILIAGFINHIKHIRTKKGDSMCVITLEDKTGISEIVFFPQSYEKNKKEFLEDRPVIIAGRINYRDEQLNIIGEKVKALNPEKHINKFEGIVLKIKAIHSEEDIIELKSEIKNNPGDERVKVISYNETGITSVILKQRVDSEKISAIISKFI